MFKEEFLAVTGAAVAKRGFLERSMTGYLIASALAGAYVGLGIILIFTIGGLLGGAPWARIIMGVSFGIALSLVIMAGSELFTGNNLVMTAGALAGKVTWADAVRIWLFSYCGNWAGSIFIAWLFCQSGLASGPVAAFIGTVAADKVAPALWPLFVRGVLCNMLVCLAVWCSFKLKSESGKLIMIFWCLYAFITSGFEHSIANMTLLTVALINGAIPSSGYFYNILVVSLGNMAGGVLLLALPYWAIARGSLKAEGGS